jgi:hypothetical protein
MLELAEPDGTPQRHEVSLGERIATGHIAAMLEPWFGGGQGATRPGSHCRDTWLEDMADAAPTAAAKATALLRGSKPMSSDRLT